MFKTKKLLLLIISVTTSLNAISQISDLNLNGFSNCIPSKNKEVINSIEQYYKEGVGLYNESINSNIADSTKIRKLSALFKIQISVKNRLEEIWKKSDSILRDESKKYFEESAKSFRELTDTINLNNPEFKSVTRALVIVEKSHQVILLQKFGLQVLFGCVRESTSGLQQPSDSSNRIVINIDMIERFRKVWNEANFPMTYDKLVYVPSERKSFVNKTFANKTYTELWKQNRFVAQRDTTHKDTTNQNLSTQNALANVNSLGSTDYKTNRSAITKDGISKNSGNDNTSKGDKNNRSTAKNQNLSNLGSDNLNVTKGKNEGLIKGEGKRLALNLNSQFEIQTVTPLSRIKTLGIDYFTIQIAASKTQLVTEKLKKNYYCGNFKIEEKNEDGWFKYIIGRFTSIDSASKYLERPCVVRGFVSGYNTKGRVAIFSIKVPRKSFQNNSSYSIVFRLQVAASKQPLTKEVLSSVYKGKNPINVSQEDGWYRYTIGDYIYFDEAKVALDSCGTKNAFVMPYQNGSRIQWPGKEALELLKANQKENPIYVVQVAASRKPLPLEVISNIIKIDHPITMKFEDGWYKYYISAFTDFATAKQVAEKIGIKGAFIATYRNGIRLNP